MMMSSGVRGIVVVLIFTISSLLFTFLTAAITATSVCQRCWWTGANGAYVVK